MRERIHTGEFYHVYNRGVDKRIVFKNKSDINRFLLSMREFNTLDPVGHLCRCPTPTNRLVDVVAYCLNPNHYHLLLKQLVEGGISEFMKRLGGGYTNHFNKKNDRSGALFQGRYKYKSVITNDYLKHVSVYVNCNHKVHGYHKTFPEASSLAQYIGESIPRHSYAIDDKKSILSLFDDSVDLYGKYVEKALQEMIENKGDEI